MFMDGWRFFFYGLLVIGLIFGGLVCFCFFCMYELFEYGGILVWRWWVGIQVSRSGTPPSITRLEIAGSLRRTRDARYSTYLVPWKEQLASSVGDKVLRTA